ncbi:MAG: DUF2892 domain-containing protein [Spirosomataceae bacterium]
MKTNMGGIDRILRTLIALVAIILYFTDVLTGAVGIAAIAVSGIFLLTSLVSFCPLYTLFGINTCAVKK